MAAFFFFAALWAILAYAQVVYMVTPVAVISVLAAAAIVIWFFLKGIWRVFTERDRSGPEVVAAVNTPREVPPGDRTRTEPAFHAYMLWQIWKDVACGVKVAVVNTLTFARVRTTQAIATVRDDDGTLSTAGMVLLFLLPTAFAVAVGAFAGIVAGLAAYVGLAAVSVMLLGVISVLWLLGWLVLGSVEQVLRFWRRIRQSCPYAGCYRAIPRPVYECPQCQQRHRRLVPNEYGLTRHDCQCGVMLPTTIALGRHRVPARCPHCNRWLPQRIGRVTVTTVPIVGGPAAGKSTLLCLAVGALQDEIMTAGGQVTYAHPAHATAIATGRRTIKSNGRVDKTVELMPDGLMLDLKLGGRADRIVYLFDPAGESYADSRGVEAQGYLDHADGLLVIADPGALTNVVRSLTDDERRRFEADTGSSAIAAGSEPEHAVSRLFELLRTRSDSGRLRRAAVVVTKTDALVRTAVGRDLPDSHDGVRAWLDGTAGWGNSIRLLEQNCKEVRYFASGRHVVDAAISKPLCWLTEISIDGSVGSSKETPPLEPIANDKRIPRGYRTGRLVTLVATLAAGISATALMVGTVIVTLTG